MKILLIPFLWILASCSNSSSDVPPKNADTAKATKPDSSIAPIAKTTTADTLQPSMELFQNMELMQYCVLLPLKEFREDFSDESVEKAEHKFVLKKDPKGYEQIRVKGFSIDKENAFNLNLFFNRDKTDLEESGLGIDSAWTDSLNHYYVIKGYLPNVMSKKFIKVVWVKEDELALDIDYTEKTAVLWDARVKEILKKGNACE